MSMAAILAELPDMWRSALTAHVPDPQGRCWACRDENGVAATWPCLTREVAEDLLTSGFSLGGKLVEAAALFCDIRSFTTIVEAQSPTETIELQFNAKIPGPSITIDGVEMKFRYGDYFRADPSTGYETLIYDCMIGDNILFQRADSVEAGWQAVQPFLDAWKKAGGKGLKVYEPGSEGPEEANDLLERDGRSWRKLG